MERGEGGLLIMRGLNERDGVEGGLGGGAVGGCGSTRSGHWGEVRCNQCGENG